jgi:NADH:ubiquinone oxidoreductase subunit E
MKTKKATRPTATATAPPRKAANPLDAIIARYAGDRGAVIPVLQEAQAALGWLSDDSLRAIAAGLGVPASQLYGVVTFYTQFRLQPVGRHLIRVCHGTACHVGGAEKISRAVEGELRVADGATTEDRKFTVESVACLGCCSLAPVIMIDGETYGRLTGDSAVKAVREW